MEILGIRIDASSHPERIASLKAWLQEGGKHLVVTPNPEMVLYAESHEWFRVLVNSSSMNIPDGIGLRFAAAAIGESIGDRTTGVDLLLDIAQLCEEEGKSLLLFGGKPRAAEKTAREFTKMFPDLTISFLAPEGLWIHEETGELLGAEEALQDVLQRAPDVLAVALGAGKQEVFGKRALEMIPSLTIAIGVGGAFEMFSREIPRAPRWMRRAGIEWLWRLLREPRRIPRIFRAVIVFPLVVIWDRLKHRRFVISLFRVIRDLIRHFFSV